MRGKSIVRTSVLMTVSMAGSLKQPVEALSAGYIGHLQMACLRFGTEDTNMPVSSIENLGPMEVVLTCYSFPSVQRNICDTVTAVTDSSAC